MSDEFNFIFNPYTLLPLGVQEAEVGQVGGNLGIFRWGLAAETLYQTISNCNLGTIF